MIFNFYTVIKALNHLANNTDPYFWYDGCSDNECGFCGANESHGCDKDCVFVVAKSIINNLDTISYKTVAKTIVIVARGETYTSRNMGIFNESCSFCGQEDHESNCPTVAISKALGIFDESDREMVEMALYTEEAEELWKKAVVLLKEMEVEKKRLRKEENKRKAEEARLNKIERTCRVCNRVLKSVDGRKQHEKDVCFKDKESEITEESNTL